MQRLRRTAGRLIVRIHFFDAGENRNVRGRQQNACEKDRGSCRLDLWYTNSMKTAKMLNRLLHCMPPPGFCGVVLLAGILLTASFPTPAMGGEQLKIGLALSSGGANGLAHIFILEVFDEMGIRPHRIAGTSIGAVIGALYASGMSAQEIRELAESLVAQEDDSWKQRLIEGRLFGWISFLDPALGEGGLLKADQFITLLHEAVKVDTFEELTIPLQVIATDLNSGEQVILETGRLAEAIEAGMAVPGVFAPVTIGGRTLVDGGLVNPVPFDVLFETCDFVIAINAIGTRGSSEDPSFMEAVSMATGIFQKSILREKMKQRAPDLSIDVQISGIHTLEFHKFNQVDQQAQTAAKALRTELEKRLAR